MVINIPICFSIYTDFTTLFSTSSRDYTEGRVTLLKDTIAEIDLLEKTLIIKLSPVPLKTATSHLSTSKLSFDICRITFKILVLIMSMYKRITDWYSSLTVAKQLVIIALFYSVLWSLAEKFRDVYWEDGSRSILSILLSGIFKVIPTMLFFYWTKIKAAFSNKRNRTESNLKIL